MANPILEAFQWGAGGAKLTPEQVARQREIAASLMKGDPAFHNAGWLGAIGRGLEGAYSGWTEGRADRAETAGRESQNALRAGLDFSNLFGGGSMAAGSPALAGSPAASTAMATAPAPDIATARVAQAHGDSGGSFLPASFLSALDKTEGGGSYDTLFGHAQRSGPFAGTSVSQMPISEVLAFASPSGAYGQHVKSKVGRVATPMGRHQIVGTTLRNSVNELGIDPSTVFDAQTQDRIAGHLARKRLASSSTMDGKVAALRSEWEGFKSVPRSQLEVIIRDIESAPSGPVAANEAMASGELANPSLTPDAVQQWAAQNYAPEQAAGVTVAETPEEIIAAEAAMAASPGAQPRLPQAAPQLPEPTMVQDMPVADVARALTGATVNPDLPMAGNTSGFLPIAQSLAAQPQGGGMPPMQQIMELASSPWATDMDRQIAGALIKQQMEQADPYRQAQLEKLQLEADQLRTGTPGASSSFGNLDAQARAAGLVPGTPQYQEFMLNGGGAPATFRALDMQARAAGFTPGTPEYNEFMATRGAGLQAGAAQTAKNVADIETGGAAAGAVDLGKASIKVGTEAWSDYGKLQTSIGNMDEAIAALDNGAQTGIIYKMLPNITEASASLQNAMDRMGLDVIGSVTFGALSEGEMRLAMQTAAPRDLPPAELRNWLAKKRDAQIKAADMLADAAQFLTKPGNTINDWIERNRAAKKTQGTTGQSSTGIQWSIED